MVPRQVTQNWILLGFWPCDLNCFRNFLRFLGTLGQNKCNQMGLAVHILKPRSTQRFTGDDLFILLIFLVCCPCNTIPPTPRRNSEIWRLQTKMIKKWKRNSGCPESVLKKNIHQIFSAVFPRPPRVAPKHFHWKTLTCTQLKTRAVCKIKKP